tara:strand:+ start:696 stop:1001 length:306 start_codon:yes stop_codon:yes gene_type:complete
MSLTGTLASIAAPDNETPQDKDADNVYEVTITASDASSSGTADPRSAFGAAFPDRALGKALLTGDFLVDLYHRDSIGKFGKRQVYRKSLAGVTAGNRGYMS